MNKNYDHSFVSSIFPTYKNYLFMSYSSLQKVLYRDLPHDVFETLCSVQLCLMHMNRMNNLFDYILSDQASEKITKTNNFDSEDILSGIAKTFEKNVSEYMDISVSYISKLQQSLPVVVHKAKLELLFLNILYCCVQSTDSTKSAKTRVSLYLTETKNSVVFHIRDNCSNINPKIIESVFSETSLPIFDECTPDAVIAFSLEGALRSAREQNYKFSYKCLKGGNRYDIHIPKVVPSSGAKTGSLSLYIPTSLFFEETFADIKLEHILRRKLLEGDGE